MMIFYNRLLLFFALAATACDARRTHKLMERMIQRESFVKLEIAPKSSVHEVIFAIQKNNIETLEKTVIERSSPGNPMYQKWLTFDQVTRLTSNVEGSVAVEKWLASQNVSITWKSIRSDYYKASSTIGQWQELFDTTFYLWEDRANEDHTNKHILAESYSLPIELAGYVSAVFYTNQAPPVISKNYLRKKNSKEFRTDIYVDEKTMTLRRLASNDCANNNNGAVTVSFLDCFYQIQSNIGEEIEGIATVIVDNI